MRTMHPPCTVTASADFEASHGVVKGKMWMVVERGSTMKHLYSSHLEDFAGQFVSMLRTGDVRPGEEDMSVKDFSFVGWTGGETLLRLFIFYTGTIDNSKEVSGVASSFVHSLSRKVDSRFRATPERVHRYMY